MRILVHDYGGYAFILQLSRQLAARGHHVIHSYSANNNTPKGDMQAAASYPDSLKLEPLDLSQPFHKYKYWRRWLQERRYGQLLSELVRKVQPDVVLSAQTPLDAQGPMVAAAHDTGAKLVFWVHDLIGTATRRLLGNRWAGLGGLVGRYYERLERRQLRAADQVIVISESFVPMMAAAGFDTGAVTVIPNWAPLDELPPLAKENEWSREMGLAQQFVFLYTGTLALKHDPSLLLDLANSLEADGSEVLVVVSEGPGANWLRQQTEESGGRLRVLDYQPYSRYAQVLACADVLVAVLTEEAGNFSVPSKVLAYSSAGRPVLAAMPLENAAAVDIGQAGFGLVVAPDDRQGFLRAAAKLKDSGELRQSMGAAARRFAEGQFDIERITDRFERVLIEVTG